VWTGEGAGPDNDALVEAGGVPIEQPEAVLALDAVEGRSAPADSQMAFTFGRPYED
jgi:hypothetical protein